MSIFKKISFDFNAGIFIYECIIPSENCCFWRVGRQKATDHDYGKWLVLKNYKYSSPNAYDMFNIRRKLSI